MQIFCLDPPRDLPYYVRRNNKHVFNIFLERRRDTIDTDTMEFNYVELIVLPNINGDVFVKSRLNFLIELLCWRNIFFQACEKDLKAYLEQKVGRPVATHVNEPQGKIRVKGADRSLVEQFLWHCGF